jgi:alpha-beta hydrolase superfamily lysophospholipase
MHKERPGKMLMILLRCLLIYAAFVFLAYLFQNRLLYMPVKTTLGQLRQAARLSALKLWPQDNEDYVGLIPENTPSTHRGTIIIFHGNAGFALDRQYYLHPLQRQGFRVILAEYPGYGARRGKSRETTLVAAGRETIRLAAQEFGGPIYLWGESLGCGVASAVTMNPDLKIDGIVLLTPWDTLSRTAQSHYWFLPALWLVRDRFDNTRNLKQFNGPVAVLMADKDKVIPNRLTQSLYRNILSPKRLWTFEGAGHNSWPVDPDLPWWIEVMDFVTGRHVPSKAESI